MTAFRRFVAECLEGVGPYVVDELSDVLGDDLLTIDEASTEVRFEVASDRLTDLVSLKTPVAVYAVLDYEVRRPKSLLSPEIANQIADSITTLARRDRKNAFASLRLSAAGSESAEFTRLIEYVSQRTGLDHDPREGDMLMRVRPSRTRDERSGDPLGSHGGGWQVLLRCSPRPLSTRAWRTQRYPGGLNATIAAAIVRKSMPAAEDRFIDLMCGSGTFIIERMAAGPATAIVGVDKSPEALAIANVHMREARLKGHVRLVESDISDLDVDALGGPFDKLVVNPPWGTLVGSHDANPALYRTLLAKAAEIAKPSSTFFVLTHDIAVFESALEDSKQWQVESVERFFQKGHHPRLFILVRTA